MEVRFYFTSAGRFPVREYLRSLPKPIRRIVGGDILAIQRFGLNAPGITLRQVRGKLWELKSSYERLFYVVAPGGTMWILHAFEKDTDRTPDRAIQVAQKRMAEVLARR